MDDASNAAGQGPADRFTWHPQYQGKTAREVAVELEADLFHDQRSYALAMEGAEEHEGDTLAAVLDYEKRWGIFDLDWATANVAELTSRIVAFEQERDRRQDLFPYNQYRSSQPAPIATAVDDDRPWWAFWRR